MTPKAGEIHMVSGGHGLMLVLQYDEKVSAAEMRGHGPAKGGHWFDVRRLSGPVSDDVMQNERVGARARGVACNNPDCWCRRVADGR